MNLDDIAAVFHRERYRMLTAREIAGALGVDRNEVEGGLRQLEAQGRASHSPTVKRYEHELVLWQHRGRWHTEEGNPQP